MHALASLARLALVPLALSAVLVTGARPAVALEFFVDGTVGDDARDPIDAQSPATPWATLGRALRTVTTGHVISIAAGQYDEALQTHYDGVKIRAMGAPGTTIVAPPAGSTGFLVRHRSVAIEGLTFLGGVHGVRAERADGLRIGRCTAVGQASTAYAVLDSNDVAIDSSAAISAADRGIHLARVGDVVLRNLLVYGNAGFGIDLEDGTAGASRLFAFNTVAYNGGATGGGMKLGAVAEVRDSIVAFNAPVGVRVAAAGSTIRSTDLFGSATPLLPESTPLGAGARSVDPGFVRPAGADGVLGGVNGYLDDDFSLRQVAGQPGEDPASPLVDAGSGPVATRDISGSTASDRRPDAGIADLGFHLGATLSPGISPPPSPTPGAGAVFHVDCARGDDSRSKLQAVEPATAWRSLRRAATSLAAGETALVQPGTCPEGVETRTGGVAFVAAEPGRTILTPPSGVAGFNVQHDGVLVDGFVVRSQLQGVLAAKSKAGDVLRDVSLRNLVVEPPVGITLIATNGIQVRDAERITVENNVVRGAAQVGILLKRVNAGYVRNNLVHGNPNDWGISIDGDSSNRYAPATGNVAAFNTVWGNQRGLRLRNSYGEIRDNIVADNALSGIKYDQADAALVVHHNDVWRSGTAYDLPSGIRPGPSNLQIDPQLRNPTAGDFALRQVAGQPGEDPMSPLVDAGSGPAATRDISGSTATDLRPDAGIADLGFHSGANLSSGIPPAPSPTPGAGAVYHVDCARGDDSRTKLQALEPAMAWRSLRRAATLLTAGEIALVQPGTCAEGVETRTAGVAFVAADPGATILAPPSGVAGFNVQHDGTLVDGFVIRSQIQGVLAAQSKAGDVLRDVSLRNLVVEPPVGVALIATNGIQVRDAERITVENNVVRGAAQIGILLKRVSSGYVRNNLVHGNPNDWGISVDGDSPDRYAPATDNVAAFNTVWGNQRGLRLRNSFGEIRDNVVAGNPLTGIKYEQVDAALVVHHNDVWQSATAYDLPSGIRPAASNLLVDPRLRDPAAGDFSLRQVAGQPDEDPGSPLVDAGSGPAATRDISGSTASDLRPDTGVADLGFHAGADPSTGVPPPPVPPSPPVAPSPSGPAQPGSGSSYYVDPLAGDDTRTAGQARNADGAWKTLGRAVNAARAGDVLRLKPGVYREQADFNADALTLRGDGPLGAVVIAPPAGKPGIYVNGRSRARIENVVVEGGSQGIVARRGADLRVTGVAVVATRSDGIVLDEVDGAWVDGSIVTGAGGMGVKSTASLGLYLRNNLVYANADWGVSLDHTQVEGAPPSTGHVVAFNTIHGNRAGLRLLNATAEVRDNNLTGHADIGLYVAAPNVTLHHNNFAANRRDRDSKAAFTDSLAAWSNLGVSPRYLDPPGDDEILGGTGWLDDDFRLQNLAAGDPYDSPSRDAGSGSPSDLDIDGSTSRDGAPDGGRADLGFHVAASAARAVPAPMPIGANLQLTYYVDGTTGDDARSSWTARRRETPWRSIARALRNTAPGDTVIVAAGTYVASVDVEVAGVRLVADAPGSVILRASGATGISVKAPDVVVDGFVIESASTGISILPAGSGAVVRNCAIVAPSSDAIRAVEAERVTVEGSVAATAGGSALRLKRVRSAAVRHNLFYDAREWGVYADGDGTTVVDLDVAGNTVVANRSGGLQLRGARGVVRDNLLTDSAGPGVKLDGQAIALLHNGFVRNRAAMEPTDYLLRCAGTCAGNRTLDPAFVLPAGADGIRGGAAWRDDDFRLTAGGGGSIASPAIDAGSGLVAELGPGGTTVPSDTPDEGILDLGFHYRTDARALPLPATSPLARDAAPADDAAASAEGFLLHPVRRGVDEPRIPRFGPLVASDALGSVTLEVLRPIRSGTALGDATTLGDATAVGTSSVELAVRRLDRSPSRGQVLVRDGCGEQRLPVGRPRSLVVGAAPAGESTGDGAAAGASLCRAVTSTETATASSALRLVLEQSGSERIYDALRVTRVCSPAALSGHPVQSARGANPGAAVPLPSATTTDPGRGSVCYRVRPAAASSSGACSVRGTAAASADATLLDTAFGTEALEAREPVELCLAATVQAE